MKLNIIKGLLFTFCVSNITSYSYAHALILNDDSIRQDLNWLNQQGVIQISTSTWPLNAAEIERQLDAAQYSETHALLQQQVIAQLRQRLRDQQQPMHFSLAAYTQNTLLSDSFERQQQAERAAMMRFVTAQAHWSGQLQLNLEQQPRIATGQHVNIAGSYIAFEGFNQQLILGQIPTYWGPAHEGSLIRGNATRAVLGVTAQRILHQPSSHDWLAWIGPWQYQVFAGQLQGRQQFSKTKLLGLRVSAQPFANVEIAAARMLQWGGVGRPEDWPSFRNAILGNDNQCDKNSCDDQDNPANQLAGLDFRINLHPLIKAPLSVYGQFVGEDEAGLWPAKKMYQLGIDYATQLNQYPVQLYFEWADTRSNGTARGISYQHHIYKTGYTQYGLPLGHGVGGDAVLYSMGGQLILNPRHRLGMHWRYVQFNPKYSSHKLAFAAQSSNQALELNWRFQHSAQLSFALQSWFNGLSQRAQTQSRFAIGLRMDVMLNEWIFR